MKLNVKGTSRALKDSEIDNLKDFVLITGANGSGKTELLKKLEDNELNPETYLSGDDGQKYHSKYIDFNDFRPHVGKEENLNSYTEMITRLKLGVKLYELEAMSHGDKIKITTIKEYVECIKKYQFDDPDKNFAPFNYCILRNDELNELEYILKRSGREIDELEFYDLIIYKPFKPVSLFTSNLVWLYLQYILKFKYYNDEAIKEDAPWIKLDKILAASGLPYKTIVPKFHIDLKNLNLNAYLIRIDKKTPFDPNDSEQWISVDDLSSGEKTIISLIFALYNFGIDKDFKTQIPNVLLFDEPDSTLHPSFVKYFLDTINEIYVKQGIKVVMTTHSPTTVALTDDLSIYTIENGILKSTEKNKAIKSLTSGLNSLTILFKNRKEVFVEAQFDKYFHESLFDILTAKSYLDKEIILSFIASGSVNDAGSSKVIRFTDELYKGGNKSIAGLLDWDSKNKETDRIKVLGLNKRYTSENYIFDPIILSFFLLYEKICNPSEIGFEASDSILSISEITKKKLQDIINLITEKVKKFLPKGQKIDEQTISVKLLNGLEVDIQNWYLTIKGHLLEETIKKAIPKLSANNYIKEHDTLKKNIVDKIIRLFPQFLPTEIIEPFKKLQDLPIT